MGRKILIMLVILVFCVQLLPVSASGPVEAKDVKIMLDCRSIECGQTPIIIGESTLLPLRSLLVGLGVPDDDQHIIWNPMSKDVTIIKDNNTVYLKIGSNKASINGTEFTLDVAPVLYKNGSTYIPVRFVSQALGMRVAWDPSTKTVLIRNEAGYTQMEDLIQSLYLSMEQVMKVNQQTVLNIALTNGKNNMKAQAEMDFSLDRDNSTMSVNFEVPLFSKMMSFKTYYTDTSRFEYDPATAKWRKYAFTKDEFAKTAGKNLNPFSSLPRELICAGFAAEDNSGPGERIIRGVVFPEGLTELISQKLQITKYSIGSCVSEIYIDEATMTIEKITMNIKGTVKGTDGTSDIAADITSDYSYPDDSYTIEFPKAIKQN